MKSIVQSRDLAYWLVLAFALAMVAVPASASLAHPNSAVLQRQDLGDFDGDGIPNYLDPDDDNDGVLDNEDYDPFNPDVWEESQVVTAEPEPSPEPSPTQVPSEPVQPVAPENNEASSQSSVPVVASLPETGTGIGYYVATPLLLAGLLVMVAGLSIRVATNVHKHP